MISTRRPIADTLLEVQNAYLDTPGLALTLPEARALFGLDEVTCAAIMKTLVEARVLAHTRAGAYIRHFPLESAA